MSFNSFINSFTNSPIQPSDVRYLPVVFSGASTNIQLEWVFQNPATLYPFCQVINITGTGTNTYSITMPNALYASTTQSTIVFNQSAANVTVYAYGYPSTSVTICVCEPGLAYYLGTTDNSTSAGTWLPPITLGAGSSSVTAASLIDTSSVLPAEPSAGGLQAYSTHLKINQAVFVYTGTAYVGNLNDLGNVVSYTAPGSGTYQLMAANTVPNGFITGLQNRSSGSGQVTINVTGSDLLNGASTPFDMLVNESTYLISDGVSNWFTFCYSANALYAINNITYNIPGSFTSGTTITVTATQAAYQIQTFQTTSGSTPTVTVVYPGIIAQQWFVNNLSTSNLLVYLSPDVSNPTYQYTIGPGGTQTMFTDGLHLYISPNFISDEDVYLPDGSVTDPSLTFVNDIHTGLYRNSTSSALVITQGSTNVATFLNTSLTSTVPIYIPSGVVTVPSLAFSAQSATGLYYTTNALNIAIEGVQTTNFNSGFLESLVPISAPVGSVGAPSFTFNGNTTTGFYYTANQLNVSVGGSSPLFFTTAGTTALSPIYALAGSDASPSYAFDGSGTSTGLYFVASPTITLSIAVSTTPVMSFTDTNITALFPVDAPTYTQDTISIYSLMRAYG